MKHFLWICILIVFLAFYINAYAEEIHLRNGDRLTGVIIKQDEKSIVLETEAMGTVTIGRDFIEDSSKNAEVISARVEKQDKQIIWKREVSLGYNKSSGNTQNTQLSSSIFVNRNRKWIDEITLKGDVYYSSSNKSMDAQKWYTMGRYAFSFGKRKNWYNFYKLESDHDRFANVDYRLVPATGMGYWLYDLPGLKAMAELALGLEHTDYRGNKKDTDEAVLVPRLFFEKEIFNKLRFSQDLYAYPAMDDFGDYRIHSETAFTNPVTKNLSLDIKVIDDYDSTPAEDAKKNDTRFISSLSYSF